MLVTPDVAIQKILFQNHSTCKGKDNYFQVKWNYRTLVEFSVFEIFDFSKVVSSFC